MIEYAIAFLFLYLTVFSLLVYVERSGEKRLALRPLRRLPSVAVIVPAHNEQAGIQQSLESLTALDYPRRLIEITVVDDGSTDATRQKVLDFIEAHKISRSPAIRLYSKKQGGKSSALNYGIARTKSEIVVTVDADSMPRPDSLKKLVTAFSDPTVAAAVCSVHVHEPRTAIQWLQSVEYVANGFIRTVNSLIDAVEVTPGPLSAFRRSVLRDVGPFDEHTITEDQEMALRLQSRHYRIAAVPSAYVYTQAPPTFRALLRQRVRWIRGGMQNLVRYSHLLHPQFGDFGVYVVPAALFFMVVLPLLFLRFIYNVVVQLPTASLNLSDPLFNLFVGIEPVQILLLTSMVAGVIWLLFASRVVSDKNVSLGALGLYFLVQPFLFPLFWAASVFEELTRRKPSWE